MEEKRAGRMDGRRGGGWFGGGGGGWQEERKGKTRRLLNNISSNDSSDNTQATSVEVKTGRVGKQRSTRFAPPRSYWSGETSGALSRPVVSTLLAFLSSVQIGGKQRAT